MPTILTSSQQTFVDITDQRKLSAYITSNLPKTQSENPNVLPHTYAPSWASTNSLQMMPMSMTPFPLPKCMTAAKALRGLRVQQEPADFLSFSVMRPRPLRAPLLVQQLQPLISRFRLPDMLASHRLPVPAPLEHCLLV